MKELAVLSRSMHHSQGTCALGRPGAARVEYDLIAGEPTTPATKDPFDGIDTTWSRLPGGAAVGQILAAAHCRIRARASGVRLFRHW